MHYDPDHLVYRDRVFQADIDAPPIVWARDKERNRELLDYYRHRRSGWRTRMRR